MMTHSHHQPAHAQAGVGEACISPKARPDWDEEVQLAAGATVARPQSASTVGYTAPWQMRWDGVSGRHDGFFAGDLLCFVMSAFKVPGAPEVDTEMAVYRVLSILGLLLAAARCCRPLRADRDGRIGTAARWTYGASASCAADDSAQR